MYVEPPITEVNDQGMAEDNPMERSVLRMGMATIAQGPQHLCINRSLKSNGTRFSIFIWGGNPMERSECGEWASPPSPKDIDTFVSTILSRAMARTSALSSGEATIYGTSLNCMMETWDSLRVGARKAKKKVILSFSSSWLGAMIGPSSPNGVADGSTIRDEEGGRLDKGCPNDPR